jgi:hypothetical protein
MQTFGPFGTSSSGVKFRPCAGATPSVGRKLALTRRPFNCVAFPEPVSVKLSKAERPIESNDFVYARSSS